MRIAYTIAPGRGDTDLLLQDVASRLAKKGVKTTGTVQINTENSTGPCDMDVRVLPEGPVLRISQHLARIIHQPNPISSGREGLAVLTGMT